MKLLIVSATRLEIEPFLRKLNIDITAENSTFQIEATSLRLLITGVGMVAAAAVVAGELAVNKYDLVLNIGVAGSFDKTVALASLFYVETDSIADLGVEMGQKFIPITQLGLARQEDIQLMANPGDFKQRFEHLPKAIAITKNTGSGRVSIISYLQRQFKPKLESMEGAAVFYAATLFKTQCIQIRSVSNYVGERDKRKWDLKGAVENLSGFLVEFLESIT